MKEVVSSDFSIAGVKLGQPQQSLQHLVKDIAIFDQQTSRTVAWSFDAEDRRLFAPHSINFVDGVVCSIAGKSLSYRELEITRTMSKQAILELLPFIEKKAESPEYYVLWTDTFRLGVCPHPQGNNFLLSDSALSGLWADLFFDEHN